MKGFLSGVFVFYVSISLAQFRNIKLASAEGSKFPPTEPSVIVNPDNPQNIVVGITLDKAIYTQDGGITWRESILQSPFGVFGDPALTADTKGNIYFFHLADPSGKGRSNDAWLDRIVCQKSTDGGQTWNTGEGIGLNPPKDNDKPWPASHPKKDLLTVTWTQFDQYGSLDSACHSNILVSKSTNKGDRWSKPVRVNAKSGDCADGDNTAMGATSIVTFDDRIFVVWSNGGTIYLDRSYDGNMWLRNDLVVARQVGGWDMKIPGLSRCNGLPIVAFDNTASPYSGSLYILWADQRNGEDDTDIWFVRSSTKGDNWSTPLRINQDGPGKHQFLPWITVDQTTGVIYIVYYDRREGIDLETDVFLSWSIDGGNHFKEIKISEKPFIPNDKVFFGDYTNISVHKGIIVPVWTRMDNGKTSVWTTIIKQADIIK